MITKEQIIDIARDELTPIGWHEEHAKYIDGLDAFAERLIKLCNISHVSNQLCDCEAHTFYEWGKDENKCSQCNKPIYKQTDL
jgi:hypothetical protein